VPGFTGPKDKIDFGVIVRTQGRDLGLLTEALQSLAFQASRCLAVVVVHEDARLLVEVGSACKQISDLDFVLLHASDKARKRGYSFNVGLQYCYNQDLEVDGIFFLDDDDIVYPFFTSIMKQAFLAKNADVIFAGSNSRRPGMQPEEGYRRNNISHIFAENFVPINSYVFRYTALRDKNILFSEELDYDEDWMFLLKLLEHGFRFEAIESTISEFRVLPDGNGAVKPDPELWQKASTRIRNYIRNSRFCLNGYAVASSFWSSNARMANLKSEIVVLQNRIGGLESDLARVKSDRDLLLQEREVFEKVVLQNRISGLELDLARIRSDRDLLLQEREVFEKKVVRLFVILYGRFRKIYSGCRKLIRESLLMCARTLRRSSGK
jgi:hypothetical protein